jgi:2-oxoisovalerate dehydrogenase E1 component
VAKPKDDLLDVYRTMLRARLVDERAIILYKQNKCHFQIGVGGHEAVQVAAGRLFKPGYDWAYPYYRDMAFCAALGVTDREFFLNILNKADDPSSGGRHMPMHYGHKELNIVSQSSPTGTQFLQAVGTAFAMKFRGKDAVVYCSAGEGTTAQGAYHEALNWAAREKLGVIFLIQDNKYAISVHISEQLAGSSVSKISTGYEGLKVFEVDGLNYFESRRVLSQAVERARKGQGPSVIDAQVVRLQSHSISDNQAKYRVSSDLERDKGRDPVTLLRGHLLEKKLITEADLKSFEKQLEEQVVEASDWAEAQADPKAGSSLNYVYAQEYPGPAESEFEPTDSAPERFLVDAVNDALVEELERNPEMVVYGEDVAGGKGGVFTATAGLTQKFGNKRVFNSQLAEDSICGTAFGMAVVGMKPVVEIQFGDYVWTGMMQIRDEFAMVLYRSNGKFRAPAVIRVAVGGYIHGGIYHSQNIEATFAHFPGLVVIYPSNARDAKGLLKAAIRSEDPVLFLEHKGLYRQVYAKRKVGGAEDLTPIGKAKIVREGSDATIITWGALVQKSLQAAAKFAEEGIEIEVIDLRTIRPLDFETISESVKKTSKVLIAQEDNLFMGFGAEISAQISEELFQYLDAPILRVGGKEAPIPHAPILEDEILPGQNDVEEGIRRLLG